jgi:hypothetical protein
VTLLCSDRITDQKLYSFDFKVPEILTTSEIEGMDFNMLKYREGGEHKDVNLGKLKEIIKTAVAKRLVIGLQQLDQLVSQVDANQEGSKNYVVHFKTDPHATYPGESTFQKFDITCSYVNDLITGQWSRVEAYQNERFITQRQKDNFIFDVVELI